MKKTAAVISVIAFICCICLTGCSGYVSSYVAGVLETTNDSDSATMSFSSFTGTKVFNLNADNNCEGILKYTGKLESGKLKVYYDCTGEKTEMFSLSDEDEAASSVKITGKGKVYIIVETSEQCKNGELSFEIE